METEPCLRVRVVRCGNKESARWKPDVTVQDQFEEYVSFRKVPSE